MPSKTSKPKQRPRGVRPSRPSSAEPACSEARLRELATQLARELGPRDWVLLEGPLGAGKSTFARALMEARGVQQPAEGSPTFAIAHEYTGRNGDVIHIDFYRLRSESEISDAGIDEYFWGRAAVVVAEWTSRFRAYEARLEAGADPERRVWRVTLGFEDDPSLRRVEIRQL